MDRREYRYRRHISWGQYVLPIFFGILIICPVGVPFFLAHAGRSVPKAISLINPLSLVFFVEGVLLWFLYYRMAGISVSVGDDEVVYHNRRGTITIPLDDITHLKFPSINYLGGWVKIISKETAIRLTVVIQDIGDFLQELKKSLDQKGLSNCYDRKKMFCFLKTAEYSDQGWMRLYRIFWKLILFTILSGIFSVLCAFVARLSTKAIILSSIAALWPTAVYLYTEFIFGRRLAKESNEESFTCPPSDRAREKTVYQKAIIFGMLIYIMGSMTALFFVTSNGN